jgi:hypothetical protein
MDYVYGDPYRPKSANFHKAETPNHFSAPDTWTTFVGESVLTDRSLDYRGQLTL